MIVNWHKHARTEVQTPAPSLARWAAVTLLAAMIHTSSYAVFRIVSGVHKQRDALVKCGREFRARAAESQWRYAVLKTSTEALVFYLNVPGFIPESEAVQRWNAGELEAVIGSERRIGSLLPELGDNSITQSDFCKRIKGQKHYVVVQRRISP